MKKMNDVTRYIKPICFASVVRSRRANAEPLMGIRTGNCLVSIGFGATVVTSCPPDMSNPTRAHLRGDDLRRTSDARIVLAAPRVREG
jgi:hypothetical protein